LVDRLAIGEDRTRTAIVTRAVKEYADRQARATPASKSQQPK
jgi:predicted transcriptional regulator